MYHDLQNKYGFSHYSFIMNSMMEGQSGVNRPNTSLSHNVFLTTGCPILDRAFGGGLSCKGITEIVGESGSGKTQLALQLLLAAQLPLEAGGREGSSMYLHTESPFPLPRLQQLASNMVGLPHNALDRVFVNPVQSADHLLDLLLRLGVVVQRDNIKMLIIDSIASLFRGVYSNTKQDLDERSKYLYKIRAVLNSLTEKYGVAVVITNQVQDVIHDANDVSTRPQPISVMTSGREVRPALGLTWGTCVNARIFLIKEYIVVQPIENNTHLSLRRRMVAVKSQYTAKPDVEFCIGSSGIFGCN